MAQNRKTIVHSTAGDYTSPYDILSQTPGNYSKDNYFLKELQEKIDADWAYRPNRAWVLYEDGKGSGEYKEIDVVLQSVLSEKGTEISSDTRNIVFKNIAEDRFVIGSKFKFNPNIRANLSSTASKDTWIAINDNFSKLTASLIIQRCNGTLVSTHVRNGVSNLHTEPVIQGIDLSGVSTLYNDTMVVAQSQMVIIAQHNDFTDEYFVNERFIVGCDKVYKVTAINKFYGNSTDDPSDVGIMKIYLEVTEESEYDDLSTRLAYQTCGGNAPLPTPTPVVPTSTNSYTIKFKTPNPVPTRLRSTAIEFDPVVVNQEGEEYPDISITTAISGGTEYVNFVQTAGSSKFTLTRTLIRPTELTVTCTFTNPETEAAQSLAFNLDLSSI